MGRVPSLPQLGSPSRNDAADSGIFCSKHWLLPRIEGYTQQLAYYTQSFPFPLCLHIIVLSANWNLCSAVKVSVLYFLLLNNLASSSMSLHPVQTGGGRLAGKVAIVTGIFAGTQLEAFNIPWY